MGNGTAWEGGCEGIEDALLEFVRRKVAVDEVAVTAQENLIDSGRVDSLGLLQILAFVDEQYHVDLLAIGTPGELQSIAGLAAAIRREIAARRAPAVEGA
jgi:acyl carrier protein